MADGPGHPDLRTGAAVGRGDPLAQTAAEPVRAAPGAQPQAVLAGRTQRHRRAQPADARDVRDHRRAAVPAVRADDRAQPRSEEHTSELQSLMRISYAVFCLKKKKTKKKTLKV